MFFGLYKSDSNFGAGWSNREKWDDVAIGFVHSIDNLE